MHKSTVLLSGLCLLLGLATVGVLWWVINNPAPESDTASPVEGNSLPIGLPDVKSDIDKRLVAADSALLWDTDAQVILFEQNGFTRHPIASITKLVTAMVAIDYGIDWQKEVTIEPGEYVVGGRLILQAGEFVTMRDLFHASLMASANNATLAYVRSLDVPEKEFIRSMNRKAIQLELEQTQFTDVTGLDTDNISTAYEVARLAEVAFRDYPEISEMSSKSEYTFNFGGSDREHTIRNSNKLITDEGMNFSGSKTGYLHEASFCLVVRGVDKLSGTLAVVLGSPSEWDSMQVIKKLLNR